MNALRINDADNVAVALADLPAGTTVTVAGASVRLVDDIPFGHKIALDAISRGSHVIKYGFAIGRTPCDVQAGQWVHSHNLRSDLDGQSGLDDITMATTFEWIAPATADRTFDGYVRGDGQVGVRNELWIIPLVGCINSLAERLAADLGGKLPHGVDGAIALSHPHGCSQLGNDLANTQRLLASLARHPNAGGVLLLSLGCENNTPESFLPLLGDYDRRRIRHLVCQDVSDEFAAAQTILQELAAQASRDRRTSVPLGRLKIGLKCGGSDALSGITANPLLGAVSDRLIATGGTSILTEVPEMFGAERALLARCTDREVFDRAVAMIRRFREYFIRHGQSVGENPSPGNREGGLTTLDEKSLGCVTKGGSGPVTDVLDYACRATLAGLVLLDGPGNDLVAATNLAAAGAQVVLFTTGRGTPFGTVAPTLKISTNRELARRKPHWIDFDASGLLESVPLDEMTDHLLDLLVKLAGGQYHCRAEENASRQIAIFKSGVVL